MFTRPASNPPLCLETYRPISAGGLLKFNLILKSQSPEREGERGRKREHRTDTSSANHGTRLDPLSRVHHLTPRAGLSRAVFITELELISILFLPIRISLHRNLALCHDGRVTILYFVIL